MIFFFFQHFWSRPLGGAQCLPKTPVDTKVKNDEREVKQRTEFVPEKKPHSSYLRDY